MCTAAVPGSAGQALEMLESVLRSLAGLDAAELPAEVLAGGLQVLERADAIGAAVRGRFLQAFDAQDGPVADGQRTSRTWLVHTTRVTRGQAGEHQAVQALARDHPVLLAALAEGHVLTRSAALQVAKWTRAIPGEFRGEAEEIVVAAARAGAGLRALAAICAEIRYRTARPDPDGEDDRHLDRGVSFETTFDGAGVIRGDLTPQCAAMVQAVLDALAAPAGGGDLRTRPQRYHDALAEASSRSRRWCTSPLPTCARWTRTPCCRTRGSPSTGPGGPPTARPPRWPPGTAAPGWTGTRRGRSPATR